MRIGFAVLLGLLVSAAAASSGDDRWETYRSERDYFSVDRPASWTVEERVDTRGASMTTFTPPDGAAIAVVVEPGTSTAEHEADVMNTRCHTVVVSGRSGRTCLDTISFSLSTTVVGRGHTYRILSNRKRGDQRIYDRVVSSFRILP